MQSTSRTTPSSASNSVSRMIVPGAVTTLHTAHLTHRRDLPVPVRFRSKEGGEECGRVEPRGAQPIHRAILAHERGRLCVSNHRIVFDTQCHGSDLRSSSTASIPKE